MTRNESCGSAFQTLNLLGSGKVAGERGKKRWIGRHESRFFVYQGAGACWVGECMKMTVLLIFYFTLTGFSECLRSHC